MTPVLFVVAAGAGALARWQIGIALPRPLGTLLVNLVGSFALGLLDNWTAPGITIVGIGAIGALTTFSTLSDDLVGLAARKPVAAALYLIVTLTGGLAAAAAGMALTG